MINVGLMHEHIIIQRLEVTPNEIGQQIESWSDYAKVHAYVNSYSGSEKYAGKRDISAADISFTVRYCKKISAINSVDFRIIFRNEVYNILFVDNYQFKNETLKILASSKEEKLNE